MPELSLHLPQAPFGLFLYLAVGIVSLCTVAVLTAVLLNFMASAQAAGQVARRQKSVVATGSMLGFFAGFYCLVHFHVGVLPLAAVPVRIALISAGLVLMVTGAATNILGRLALGQNWANQVTVYDDQQLVTRGVYGLVRHPLYASLIWMFYGASLIYHNYAAFLATSLIFLPAMYYRGKQEEALLSERFADYEAYRRRVGMFFPKPQGGASHDRL